MFRKGIVLVVVLLLVCVSIPSTGREMEQTSTMSTDGKTWYVGGSGPGNYTKIQDAIDNASNGDTVYVFSGTYVEDLEIKKTIKLIAEYKETTVVDGSLSLYYYASGIEVNGFTINNSIALEYSHDHTICNNILIFGNIKSQFSFRNTIANNTIQNGNIFLKESRENKIVNNTLFSNGIRIDRIRRLDECNSHIIENNTIDGIPIRYYKNANDIIVPNNTAQVILANCKNFTIMNLNISNINYAIQLFASKYNIISNNHIFDTPTGARTGIYLGDSTKNILSHNTIHNKRNGIHCEVSRDNTIIENNIYKNSIGIFAFDSPCITIKNNSIKNNGVGIAFSLGSATIDGNNISNNIIGVQLDATLGSIVSNNEIKYNTKIGVSLLSFHISIGESCNNVVRYNNIIGNNRSAYFENALFTRWRGNYWDKARFLPKCIRGEFWRFFPEGLKTIPWFNFDWRPAKKPYDIGE